MYIANATGCSSIWGNSSPSTPYTTNAKGQGPAWSNSLFEDNAEFGYGMLLAQRAIRGGLKEKIEDLVANGTNEDVKAAGQEWLDTYAVGATNGAATEKLVAALEACGCDKANEILAQKDFLSKKSQWIFGGDGWAYDIGFGWCLTTFLQADVTSTLWYSIQRFTPTQADSLPSLHLQVRSHSSQLAVKRPRRKIWLLSQ